MKKNTAALILALLITATGSLTAQMAASTSATPALLLAFTGKAQSSDALLAWTMEGQTNCKWFVIERSGDTGGYDSIGVVIGINNGNANNYTFSDDHMLKGNNYYRILQRDLDLKSAYSEVRTLAFTRAGNLIWYTTGSKSIEVRLQNGSTELYTITNVSGQQIRKGRLSGGVTSLSGVAGGIYFVKVINAAGAELNTKVIIP